MTLTRMKEVDVRHIGEEKSEDCGPTCSIYLLCVREGSLIKEHHHCRREWRVPEYAREWISRDGQRIATCSSLE